MADSAPGTAPIDIDKLARSGHRYEVSLNNETAEDATQRRTQEAAEAALRRRMTFIIFVFALLVTSIVFGACLYVLTSGSADDKKWATGVISAITSGLVGFLVGQARR